MTGRFDGKIVLLTGAASGIGAAAARRLASEGANLELSDISMEAVVQLAESLRSEGARVRGVPLDVASADGWKRHAANAVEHWGRIDIAVNNAGIGGRLAPIWQQSEDDWDRVMAVNAKGVFLGIANLLPTMIRQGGGTILNVASAAGLVGAGRMAPYAASKHAVVGLTRAAADEAARHGVTVNALCPSFASTPLFDALADTVAESRGIDRKGAYDAITGRVPMRRAATIEEIVHAMLAVIDPANTFQTGQAIAVDGGLTAI